MISLADGRSLIFRGSLSPTRAIEAFLDPVVIVLMLVLVTTMSGAVFDKRYFILAFVAFSAHFPGQPFLSDSTRRTIRRALVGWVLFSALLLLFFYASHYIDAFSRAALFAWLGWTPVAVVVARIGARELLPRFLALEGQYRSAVIVGCNAWVIESENDPVFQEIHPVRAFGKRPYEDLLQEVKSQLGE